ncbi:MAG: hypothetical protein K6F72_02965 [Bacteroidales bacterium]|nr:hypothetical protein [Bacteroidales bacterium]
MQMNKIATVAFLLLANLAALGQSAVYEAYGIISMNSIIRSYDQDIDIVYNDNGLRSFLHVNRTTGSIVEAQIPNLQAVADMEIERNENKVYFCGQYSGNPVIGRFSINNLFFGTGQVEIIPINITPPIDYNGPTGAMKPQKLEVQYINSADIHVYIIGYAELTVPNYPPGYTVLYDAMYNGTIWDIEHLHEPGGNYLFYDLTVTNNFLMMFGEKQGGQADYFSHCDNAISGNHHLSYGMSTPPSFNMSDFWPTDYYPITKPLVETLSGDVHVTAGYAVFDGDSGIVISKYSLPSALTDRWFIPNITVSTGFRDLKYNRYNNKLYLVPELGHTVVTDLLYVFDLTTGTAQVYQSSVPNLSSVDALSYGNGAVVSGISPGGYLNTWLTNNPVCNCDKLLNVAVQRSFHTDNQWLVSISYNNFSTSSIYVSPYKTSYILYNICR